MMFRLILVAMLLAVSPLAQAVQCVMAEAPAVQAVQPHCPMMGVKQSPTTHSMSVAECLELKAVTGVSGDMTLPVQVAVMPPTTQVVKREMGVAVLSVHMPRAPPYMSGRGRLQVLGRWQV